MKLGLIVLALLVSHDLSAQQSDSLVDLFPLHIGNGWTYSYEYGYLDNESGSGQDWRGTASLVIIDSLQQGDSAKWIFRQIRDVQYQNVTNGFPGPWNPVMDTTVLTLTEWLQGRHWMYVDSAQWFDILAFNRTRFFDPESIFRYRALGLTDTVTVLSGAYGMHYEYTFGRNAGIERVHFYSGNPFWMASGTHYLLDRTITDVPTARDPGKRPFILYSAYPNPFNLATTISYTLPQGEFVRVTVFDVLGREALNLVREFQIAGTHSQRVDASMLSSGVYLYQVQAGEHVKASKFILVK